jgi:hypothetical protein
MIRKGIVIVLFRWVNKNRPYLESMGDDKEK